MHSSFPPTICDLNHLSKEAPVRLARLYELLLCARHASSEIPDRSEEDDDLPTNPAIPSIYPGSIGNNGAGQSSSKGRGAFQSGIYPLTESTTRKNVSNS